MAKISFSPKMILLSFLLLMIIRIFVNWYESPRGVIVDAGKENTFPCVEYDPQVFHRRRPSCSGWGKRGGRNVFHSYNRMGLRDVDYSSIVPKGEKRILLLGSSNLAGPGLEFANTAGALLNTGAKKMRLPWHFINGATDAYFTLHSRIKLPEYLTAYNPQIVVHHLASRNGIYTDAMLYRALYKKSETEYQILRSPWDRYPWLKYFISPAEPLSEKWFRVISWNEQLQRAYLSWRANAFWLSEQEKIAVLLEPTIHLLRDMRAIVESRGGQFIVLWNRSELVPDQHVPPGMDIEFAHFANKYLIHGFMFSAESMTQYLRSTGLPVVEIWDPRLSYAEYRLPGDFHWNERGAKLFADHALAALKKYFGGK